MSESNTHPENTSRASQNASQNTNENKWNAQKFFAKCGLLAMIGVAIVAGPGCRLSPLEAGLVGGAAGLGLGPLIFHDDDDRVRDRHRCRGNRCGGDYGYGGGGGRYYDRYERLERRRDRLEDAERRLYDGPPIHPRAMTVCDRNYYQHCVQNGRGAHCSYYENQRCSAGDNDPGPSYTAVDVSRAYAFPLPASAMIVDIILAAQNGNLDPLLGLDLTAKEWTAIQDGKEPDMALATKVAAKLTAMSGSQVPIHERTMFEFIRDLSIINRKHGPALKDMAKKRQQSLYGPTEVSI